MDEVLMNDWDEKIESVKKSVTSVTNSDTKPSDFVTSVTDTSKSPSPSSLSDENEVLSQRETADLVIEMIRGKIAYNSKSAEWFRRKDNIWVECDADTVNPFVIKALDKVKNKKYSFSVVTSIKNFVRDLLRIHHFETSRMLLPLQNGVFNLHGNQLESYNDYQFSWELPYEYNPDVRCPSVLRYLLTATSRDRSLVRFLLAWMRVLIAGEYTVQKYIELVGDGGTGKSTFLELCTLLIGENNRVVTDLKSLESNRFESANLQGKRLALITDSSRYSGEVAQLKALTGGDAIRNEKKNKQAGKGLCVHWFGDDSSQ